MSPAPGLDAASLADRICALVSARQAGAPAVQVQAIKPLSGGNARRAWAFDVSWQDAKGSHSLECVLLGRLEAGQLEVDARTEYEALRLVSHTDLPVPKPLWIDEDGSLLGMPGFVMTRGKGIVDPSSLLKPGSLITGELATQLVRLAARIHALDWRSTGTTLAPAGGAQDAARQVLSQWQEQFEANRLEPLPALASIFTWLQRNLPSERPVSLIHGDMRIGNFLYEGQNITMLLDWELAHLGDPLEDLCWMYRRIWGPQAHLSLDDAVKIYEQESGQMVDRRHLLWYRIFSEAKFAVISLTGVRNFLEGGSDHLRLAGRASSVNGCLQDALRWIEELEST